MADPAVVAALARQSGRLPLHFELYALALKAAPRLSEIDDLVNIVDAVGAVAQSLFTSAKAVLFGSQPSGLSLPGSDLDLVILGVPPTLSNPTVGFTKKQAETVGHNLAALRKALIREGLVSKARSYVVSKAKVPIIKCHMRVPGKDRWVPVDVSMGVANGAEAVHFAVTQAQALPPLRPLLLFLKAALKERDLNEVRTGGLSSYCLLNMVIAHLQMEGYKPASVGDARGAPIVFDTRLQLAYSRQLALAAAQSTVEGAALLQADLGTLLLGFLKRFGAAFDWERDGISVRQGGVVPKHESWCQVGSARAERLALEDPQEPGNEIGGGSYLMPQISRAFQELHDRLAHSVTLWQRGHLTAVTAADRWAAVQADGSHRSVATPAATRSLQIDNLLEWRWALSETPLALRNAAGAASSSALQAGPSDGEEGGKKKPKKEKKKKGPKHEPGHLKRRKGARETGDDDVCEAPRLRGVKVGGAVGKKKPKKVKKPKVQVVAKSKLLKVKVKVKSKAALRKGT